MPVCRCSFFIMKFCNLFCSIDSEHFRVVTVTPVDTVLMASKKMLECQTSCAIVTVDEKPQGILTFVLLFNLVFTSVVCFQ